MGSFGTTEIILILVVGFIILGPKGLSKLVKTIGKILGELSGIKDEVKKSMEDVQNSVNDAVMPINRNDYHRKARKVNDTKKTENNDINNKGEHQNV